MDRRGVAGGRIAQAFMLVSLKDHQPIAGANGPTLVISDVGIGDVASYQLKVQGPGQNVTSQPADLGILTTAGSTNSWQGPDGPPGGSRGTNCPGVYACVA